MLLRAFARVDDEGKVYIPQNIREATKMKKGQLVELKVAGGGKKSLIVSAQKNSR